MLGTTNAKHKLSFASPPPSLVLATRGKERDSGLNWRAFLVSALTSSSSLLLFLLPFYWQLRKIAVGDLLHNFTHTFTR